MADIASHWDVILLAALVFGVMGIAVLKSPFADSQNGAWAGAFVGGCAGLLFIGAAGITLLILGVALLVRLL